MALRIAVSNRRRKSFFKRKGVKRTLIGAGIIGGLVGLRSGGRVLTRSLARRTTGNQLRALSGRTANFSLKRPAKARVRSGLSRIRSAIRSPFARLRKAVAFRRNTSISSLRSRRGGVRTGL